MVKKLILVLTMLYFFVNVSAQKDTLKPTFIAQSYDYKTDKDKLMGAYVDSLNNLGLKDDIPRFVFDECLEYDIILRGSYHSDVSVRWEILKKVTNKAALQMILQSDDRRLKARCGKYKGDRKLKIPFSDKSFYDLVEKRYGMLK